MSNNPFDLFKSTQTKHTIAALNGAEVTLRTLSLAENAEVDAILYAGGFNDDGTPIISMENITKAKLARVAKSLLEPKMTIAQLNALSVSSMEAINEITEIINPTKDKEGKS